MTRCVISAPGSGAVGCVRVPNQAKPHVDDPWLVNQRGLRATLRPAR